MPKALSSLVPDVNDLLALEVEELAGILLIHLGSYGNSSGNGIVSQGSISQHNFFNMLGQYPEYPGRQTEVNRALMEAWSWLENEGLLVRDAEQYSSPWFFISRRAQQLRSREDLASYRNANLLPKGQLHPLISAHVYPAFLRGEYDTAVFQAFREVEIAVRTAGKFSPDDIGVALMRAAFRPFEPEKSAALGSLTDSKLPIAEQNAMAHLFAGAIGLYKNPQSHRYVPTGPYDAAKVIVFASHLLRIVDRLKENEPPAEHVKSEA
jgi:uncharacterized protein (TIGR02391 family)